MRIAMIIVFTSVTALADPWTFISSPDLFNSDIADLSGGTDTAVAQQFDAGYAANLVAAPGWPQASGGKNSVTAAMAATYNQLLQEMVANAGGDPLAFVVAGDLLNGRWFNKNTTKMFNPSGGTFGKLNTAADVYYSWYLELFRQNGIHTMIAAIGDHDVGDNDWGLNSEKSQHVNTMKVAFGRNMVAPLNLPVTWNGIPSRAPAGLGEYDEGSFVLQIQNVLFVTIDVFEFEQASKRLHYRYGKVDANVSGDPDDPSTHLGWLNAILTAADADPTIDHVILQGHSPTLRGVRKQASSGMMTRDRDDSGFWRCLQAHDQQHGGKVRLYFAGEVHTVTASKDPESDIIQLVHGNPPLGNGGGNYVVFTVDGKVIEADLYQFDLSSVGGGDYWQPSKTNSAGCGSMTTSEHTGRFVIDASGTDTIYESSGWLVFVNPNGMLLHYGFDKTLPNGNVSNTGELGDLYYSAWRHDDPVLVTGKFGQAMFFDNDGDFIKTAGGLAPVTDGEARSITGWFKSSWTNPTQAQWDTIFGYGQDNAANGEFNVRLAKGTIHLHISNNTLVYADTGRLNLYDGRWHHFAVVLPDDHDNYLSDVVFIIDAVEYPGILQTPGGENRPIRTYPGASSHIHIGASAEDLRAPGNRFYGSLDDISMWGGALSVGKVRALATAGNHPALVYDVLKMAQLFEIFDAGQGEMIIDENIWTVTQGLSGQAGDILEIENGYAIVLDENGKGVRQR